MGQETGNIMLVVFHMTISIHESYEDTSLSGAPRAPVLAHTYLEFHILQSTLIIERPSFGLQTKDFPLQTYYHQCSVGHVFSFKPGLFFASPVCVSVWVLTDLRYLYDFISIENRGGCFSSLGRVGGMQVLSLNRRGCLYHGIIQHEINHALGFQHEQTRSDRDQYVKINWENIDPQMAYNFYKQNTNNLNTPYDYSSIMHYGRTAFSIAYGKDSITPIPNPNVQIGQRQGMSYWDIMRINALYQC
ncbi:high choriolytic enzyme 1-like [Synchiropus splendidus]|uniref:high choriolytic enzyme 1-like n=1 Tax=Synchiropus splendidus TaxID=270530 RepID=UPI00237E91A5|nr:high choriolytic enzyme 1-like [Synchiropus splendidus]